jgi:hypothetical protein
MTEAAVDQDLKERLEQDDRHLRAAVRRRARADFGFFLDTIFAQSIAYVEGKYVEGEHISEWASRLQSKKKTTTVAARKHMKTTVFLAYVAWQLFRVSTIQGMVHETLYMSYSAPIAAEKIKLLKTYISVNLEFDDFIDLKPTAETLLEYRHRDKIFRANSAGIFSIVRGKHPNTVIVDDPLKDPEDELNIEQIEKVGKHFFKKIVSLPKEGGELHIAGTPQDKNDLFGKLKVRKGYNYKEYPAIRNYKTKDVLWPEMFPFERLIDIRDNEVGPAAFEPEYQCAPKRSAEGYLAEPDLDRVIDPKLQAIDPDKEDAIDDIKGIVVAAIDIGKKQHPSHITMYDVVEDEDEDGNDTMELTQIYSKWLDGWDYNDQVELCKHLDDVFSIDRFPYDNTRSEFEGFEERGELPGCMEPVKFTRASKFKSAASLDKALSKGKKITIRLLDDPRQKRQMLNVDNDLQSVSTKDGHGDSFWSNALAVEAATEAGPQVR